VENVPEFLAWRLFPAWKMAMESLGYSISPHIFDAADFAVPQHRRRVFIVCTKSKAPVRLSFEARPHHAFSGSLSKTAEGWSPIATKCDATRARVENGRRAHGSRFLIAYYGNEKGGRSLTRPLGTVTTRDRYALVDGENMRMLNADEYRRAMGFRADYRLPASSTAAKFMLGNAVCPPVAADVIRAVVEKL
jgi:DNA (cytosine-5)-methyltransferase 1